MHYFVFRCEILSVSNVSNPQAQNFTISKGKKFSFSKFLAVGGFSICTGDMILGLDALAVWGKNIACVASLAQVT